VFDFDGHRQLERGKALRRWNRFRLRVDGIEQVRRKTMKLIGANKDVSNASFAQAFGLLGV
jgi:hypothetical protein